MKNWLIVVLFAAFFGFAGRAFTQCNPQVHGVVFSYGVTDSITPLQFVQGPYYVCDNATLYYYGNNPDTVYLESSARLRVGYAYNLVVYMRNNAIFAMDTATANWQTSRIVQVNYDPAFTSFQDTAGVLIQSMNSCPSMGFDYSLYPNNVSPCSLPSSVAENVDMQGIEVYPNPAFSELNLENVDPRSSGARLVLVDAQGRTVRSENLNAEAVRWDISNYPRGIYLLGVLSENGITWRRVSFL